MVRNLVLYHSKILLYWNNDTNIGIFFGMAKCFFEIGDPLFENQRVGELVVVEYELFSAYFAENNDVFLRKSN